MDYKVHPVAEMFPLIAEGSRAWEDLVESMKTVGQVEPIVLDGDTLIDGRNRLRVCEVLNIVPRSVQWSTLGCKGEQAEWIAAKNLERRHLTDEQKVAIASDVDYWLAVKQNEDRRKAAQFQKGNSGGPGGDRKSQNAKSTVDPKSGPPLVERDIEAKHAKSTVGRIASKAGASRYKAEQAIKVKKAVENGTVSQEKWDGIKQGTVKLNDVVKEIEKPKTKSFQPIEKRVETAWKSFLAKFPTGEHAEVKSIVLHILQ